MSTYIRFKFNYELTIRCINGNYVMNCRSKNIFFLLLFQCRDVLELKVLELCPELTLLGETLDEASSLQAEHERVLEKIQVWIIPNRLFTLQQRFERNAFNFRTINAPGASRLYCYMHRIIIYYGERRQFRFETRPLRFNHFISVCTRTLFINVL